MPIRTQLGSHLVQPSHLVQHLGSHVFLVQHPHYILIHPHIYTLMELPDILHNMIVLAGLATCYTHDDDPEPEPPADTE